MIAYAFKGLDSVHPEAWGHVRRMMEVDELTCGNDGGYQVWTISFLTLPLEGDVRPLFATYEEDAIGYRMVYGMNRYGQPMVRINDEDWRKPEWGE